MKYVWIVMLVIIEIVWAINSVLDIIGTVLSYGMNEYTFDHLDDSTQNWVVFTALGLFIVSVLKWLGVW